MKARTFFFWLAMLLFGPAGLLGCNPPLIFALFGLYFEHPGWYP